MKAPRFLQVTLAVAGRNIHNGLTNPSLLIPSIFAPLVFFIVFAGGMSGLANSPGFTFPGGYTTFAFIFVLVQAAVFAGAFAGIGMAQDFEAGFIRRLFLAAPARGGIVAGYALGAVGRLTISYLTLFAAGLIAGVKIRGSVLEIGLLVVLMVGLTVASALWAAGVAMRFRSAQSAPLMITPIFLLMFLAPAFLPLALLTGWIHSIAEVNPISFVLEAGRGLIVGQPNQTGPAFLILGAMAIVLSLWAWRGLHNAETSA